jgi:YHS domain-containing protein
MNQPLAWVLAVGLLLGGITGCKSEQAAAAAKDEGQAKAAATSGASKPLNGFDGMPPVGTKAKCPVMGTDFEVTKETQSSVYKGKTYVFCCPGCKPQFDASPEKYVGS